MVVSVVSLLLALMGPPVIARGAPSGPQDPRSTRALATAPSATWSGATRIGRGSFGAVAIVFDSADHAHIVADGRSAGRFGIWYLTDRSGTWTQKRVMADAAGKYWQDPSITVDADDRITIAAWRASGGDPAASQGIFTVTDRGRARGSFPAVPTQVVAAPAAMPVLKTAGTRLAMAYVSDLPDVCWPLRAACLPALRFRTGVPGHWTTTTIAQHAVGPSLRLDAQGRARIAYATDKDVRYASAGTTTGSFSVTKLPGTSSADDLVALALDSGDQPSVAWVHAATPDTIRYARSDGGWGVPITVATAPVFTAVVGIALDGSDVPHILAAGRSVREETRVGGAFVETILATGVDAAGGAIRVSASGREIVLWTADSGGLFMAQRTI